MNWGFSQSADILPDLYVSIQARQEGLVRITWVRRGTRGKGLYYVIVLEEDTTQDQGDMERRVEEATWKLIDRGFFE